jgi:hypothetical protein
MKKLPIIIATGFVVSFTGCAGQPISNSAARFVPANRVLDEQFVIPDPSKSQVTVKRDSGFFGGGCTARVFINAKPVADVDASEKVVLYLPEGDFILAAWPKGICGGSMTEVTAAVKKGVPMSFRIGYGSNGDFSINPTAF